MINETQMPNPHKRKLNQELGRKWEDNIHLLIMQEII